MSIGLGADYVHRTINSLAPADVANGLVNSFSNNFTVGTQDVASAYGELVAPITKQFEAEGALRYDHYNISGGKASPKVGFKYTPITELAIRGTASRGFRAPGPAENGTAGQTFFAGTSNDPVLCANGNPTTPGNFPSQCAQQVGTVQGTNTALKPETSKSYTLGLIFEPTKDISTTVDFYQIEIDNQIVAGSDANAVRGTNLVPCCRSNETERLLLSAPVAPIAFYQVADVNANSVKTNGVDLGFEFCHNFEGVGKAKSNSMMSYMNKYDFTIGGQTFQLAGTHGPFVIGGDTGNPRSRIQWANTLGNGPWSTTLTLNYISGFSVTDPSSNAFGDGPQDTCNQALSTAGASSVAFSGVLSSGGVPNVTGACRVRSFTTFDLSGRYDVSKQLNIHGSILNLFNQNAPLDWRLREPTMGPRLGIRRCTCREQSAASSPSARRTRSDLS